jgi:hypothetical protein
MTEAKDILALEIATAQQILKECIEFAFDEAAIAVEVDDEELEGTDEENLGRYLRDLEKSLTEIGKTFREL